MNFKNAKAYNFEGAFRGLRNPMNSWNGSDSFFGLTDMYMEDSLTDVCEAWIDNENIGRRERGAEELSHDMENYEEYYDFTSLEFKVVKFIKEGKIKSDFLRKYGDFEFHNSKGEYKEIINKSIEILKSLPTISQEDIKTITKDYLNMIIFGYITNQVNRNLNNYGLICNKKTRKYYFAPLFENCIISMPNLKEKQCNFNGVICDRNKLIDSLFDDFYDKVKNKVEFIVNNKQKLINNIDIIAKQNLDLDTYNDLMQKIINNLSYIEKKYNEKNNIESNENAGFINILQMVTILSIITIISIAIAAFLYRL